MHARLLKLGQSDGKYMLDKIGEPPRASEFNSSAGFAAASSLYQEREKAICTAVANSYVESAFLIHVPFFGFSFDSNDLGLLSGVSFLVVLSCFRFFLYRELDNLRLSFNDAREHSNHELRKLYKLLGMRQVFTVPEGKFLKPSFFLMFAPKAIPWLPSVLLLTIITHDFLTAGISADLTEVTRFGIEQAVTIAIFIYLVRVTSLTVERMNWMDEIWGVVYRYLYGTEPEKVTQEWEMAFTKNQRHDPPVWLQRLVFRLLGPRRKQIRNSPVA